MRIYVAAPYSARTKNTHTAVQEVAHNVDKAIRVAIKLIEKGHYPFVPHLSHYIHTNMSCPKDYGDWYYDYDNSFLTHWAEALFYVEPSFGADNELKLAKKLGLEIFFDLDEVPEAK